MAETTQALIASLRADVSGFRRDMQNAIQSAEEFGRRGTRSLSNIEESSRRTARATSSLATTFNQLKAAILGLGLGRLIKEGFELASAFRTANLTLQATTGGAGQAAEAYKFVRAESLRLGTDILKGAKAFGLFTDAARGTSLEGASIRRLFTGISTATTVLGLSTDEYRRILIATQQVLTRTKVQTEELNQLTESGIPIRKELADVLGLTGEQLAESLQKGLIPAEALVLTFERLEERFRKTADEIANSTPVAFKSLITASQEAAAKLFDAAFASEELNTFLRQLTNAVVSFTNNLNTQEITNFVNEIVRLGKAVFESGKDIIDFFERLSPKNLIGSLGIDINRNIEAIQNFVNTQLQALGASQETAAALTNLIAGTAREGESATQTLNRGIESASTALLGLSNSTEDITDDFKDIERDWESLINAFDDGSQKGQNSVKSLEDRIKELRKTLKDAELSGRESSQFEKDEKAAAAKVTQLRVSEKKKEAAALKKIQEDTRKDFLQILNRARQESDQAEIDDAKKRVAILTEIELKELIERERKILDFRKKLRDAERTTIESSASIEQENADRRREEAVKIAEERLTKIRFNAIDQRTKNAIDAAKEELDSTNRIFDTARENIQEAYADLFTDIFSGQLDTIGDFADQIVKIFAQTAAEILAALIIKPAFENFARDIQDALSGSAKNTRDETKKTADELTKLAEGVDKRLTKTIDKTKEEVKSLGKEVADLSGSTQGKSSSGRTAALATGITLLVSNALRDVEIPSAGQRAFSGAITGATLGFQTSGPYGAAYGAVAGGLLGAFPDLPEQIGKTVQDVALTVFGDNAFGRSLARDTDPIGYLLGLGGGPKQSRLAVQTTAQRPSVTPSDNALIQGAFGFISLVDDQSKRANAREASLIVAELDRTIFNITSRRQRELIQAALQSPANNALIGEAAADTDDAINEVLAQRIKIQLAAIGGARVAETVVGALGEEVSDQDLSLIQRRAEDAIAILKIIEDISGPKTDSGRAIKQINEEFDILISRAQEFGISTVKLEEERQRRIAEVRERIDENTTQRILEITDPARAAQEDLARRQAEQIAEAREANANVIELERLHVLEREQLARDIEQANRAAERQFRDFVQAGLDLSPVASQLQTLKDQYDELVFAAQEAGRTTEDLTRSYINQVRRIRQEINQDIAVRTAELLNPGSGAAERLRLAIQQAEEVRDAVAAEADLVALERLHRLEREALGKDLREQARQIQETRRSFAKDIAARTIEFDSPERAAQFRLAERQRQERLEAIRLGESLVNLERLHRLEREALIEQIKEEIELTRQRKISFSTDITARTIQFDDPGRAEHIRLIERQKVEYQEAIKAGVNLLRVQQLHRLELQALAEQRKDDARKLRLQNERELTDFLSIFGGPLQPLREINAGIREQLEKYRDLLLEGIITQEMFDAARALVPQIVAAQEALKIASGGNKNPIEQLQDTFDDFIKAGNPLSQFSQELHDLTETFINLRDAAQLVGTSTRELEISYIDQARAIQERLIEAIDQELESRIQGVRSINELLSSFRVGEELPGSLRLSEAKKQFDTARTSGDIQAAIDAANQLREIARGEFGSGRQFFDIQQQIETALINLRDQEQRAIEDERQRLLEQAEREQRQIAIGQSSLSALISILNEQGNANRNQEKLLSITTQSAEQQNRVYALLERALSSSRR